ncbi:MAG: outer membrane beta-barrel protein [Acidithiobacillus ferriphilus]|uniref:outer membrane beta-barrel protein n=1 Tax=Acidithiobacillus TaxID=119977 RepID=UPI001C06A708|nr:MULTISPECIES: outer membrane beta-barrel protein [Acidithiobacillus]MBU2828403.1 porin [Acidithiobacillus ferriphilus]MBU2846547.1 porin [Acidithiobacillus ferriphilus]MDA8247250.1 outer membrane beta-barrel protein [Acidithiobacillus sp.]UEP58048.1 porin [Acidithiobacillus ferriphilus]
MLHHNANHASRSLRRSVLAATALSLPMIAGVAQASPLSMPAPLTFSAGPLGKLDVQGIASGMAFYQDFPQGAAGTMGAKHVGADITNGMVIIQKNTGTLQFYIQAGAYSFPTLAAAIPSSTSNINDFGAMPVAYLKYAPSSDYSVEVGKLPTLIGAEGGFTYQNINIARGLLWDVEPIVSRGVQFNASKGPISASVSLNDGYYSNRYNVMSGLLSYAINGSNTVSFYAQGPLGNVRTSSPDVAYSSYGTSSDIYGVEYVYSSGPWMIEPYVQYMHTPQSNRLGIAHSFSNYGASVLADYSFTNTISLGGRVEYLGVGGKPGEMLNSTGVAATLTDLPADSHAWSITLTPTYQDGGFFARADLSYVAASAPAGLGLSGGTNTTQLRGMLETGFMF